MRRQLGAALLEERHGAVMETKGRGGTLTESLDRAMVEEAGTAAPREHEAWAVVIAGGREGLWGDFGAHSLSSTPRLYLQVKLWPRVD